MFKLFTHPVLSVVKNTYKITNEHFYKKFCNLNLLQKREFKFWSNKGIKVVVLGANGHVGQNVAFLLKQCSVIDELTLYDVASTAGLCMELNCIDTKCEVTHFDGQNCLKEALDVSKIFCILFLFL